jgi:hypothetical protein
MVQNMSKNSMGVNIASYINNNANEEKKSIAT